MMKRAQVSFNTRLLGLPNPFHRVKKGFTRYVVISAISGTVSFLIALGLLHLQYSPFISLAISVIISGLLGYGLLELWGFPHRSGRLSWRRLMGFAAVGTAAFAARYAVLTFTLPLLHISSPYDKALALLLAYTASFILGYSLRRYGVFKK